MAPATAVVIGAGERGKVYAQYALDFPDRLQIVGVAEPRKFYREQMQKEYNIPQDAVFTDWTELVKRDKFADSVFVATPDRKHKDPAIACAKKGYHILVEKPMAVTEEDCKEIVSVCQQENVMLAVCHVLRYTPAARKIRQIIDSGAIGDVVHIQHTEPVGYFHFAHSYVRGNWRNTATSSFSLLSKSCHDLDLICYWLGGRKCTSVSSFGGLRHFRDINKPAGAGDRCLDCAVERGCPYSAKKIYLDQVKLGYTKWPVSVITEVPDIESVTEALKTGPYGRCVYGCDNDVADHQIVNMQFEGGATASFTMIAFTELICIRQTKVFGTLGEVTCDFSKNVIKQFQFCDEDVILHNLDEEEEDAARSSRLQGHGGADFYMADTFVQALLENSSSKLKTGAEESLASHLLCFAAEKSRLENRVVKPQEEKLT